MRISAPLSPPPLSLSALSVPVLQLLEGMDCREFPFNYHHQHGVSWYAYRYVAMGDEARLFSLGLKPLQLFAVVSLCVRRFIKIGKNMWKTYLIVDLIVCVCFWANQK